ncbi:MAG: outer membrane lipoprotein-sorting protein [Bacteroides sp.]|jgi:outer membrane lipoprotein-sorting protein|nr:outer membrane lipoprotein-sorting protein [Bacteroides sp.]
MKTTIHFFLTALFLIAAGTAPLLAQDAATILTKVDQVLFQPKDQTNTVRMILTDRNGNERIREASIWQKGSNKRLFRFTRPASEAGIAFLSLPDDLMYLYMPAFGKARRIASHVKNQSFAGTDFSYEDMETKEYAKTYSGKVLREEGNLYILELVALPDVRSDYSKMIVAVNKENYTPQRSESYDRGGNLAKTAVYTWQQQANYWFPKEIFMKDEKKGSSTRMIMSDVKFDSNISDQVFTERNLTSF